MRKLVSSAENTPQTFYRFFFHWQVYLFVIYFFSIKGKLIVLKKNVNIYICYLLLYYHLFFCLREV